MLKICQSSAKLNSTVRSRLRGLHTVRFSQKSNARSACKFSPKSIRCFACICISLKFMWTKTGLLCAAFEINGSYINDVIRCPLSFSLILFFMTIEPLSGFDEGLFARIVKFQQNALVRRYIKNVVHSYVTLADQRHSVPLAKDVATEIREYRARSFIDKPCNFSFFTTKGNNGYLFCR